MKRNKQVQSIGTVEHFLQELEHIVSYLGVKYLLRLHFYYTEEGDTICAQIDDNTQFLFERGCDQEIIRYECSMIHNKQKVLFWYQERKGRNPFEPCVYDRSLLSVSEGDFCDGSRKLLL